MKNYRRPRRSSVPCATSSVPMNARISESAGSSTKRSRKSAGSPPTCHSTRPSDLTERPTIRPPNRGKVESPTTRGSVVRKGLAHLGGARGGLVRVAQEIPGSEEPNIDDSGAGQDRTRYVSASASGHAQHDGSGLEYRWFGPQRAGPSQRSTARLVLAPVCDAMVRCYSESGLE
jgi:hypothetical protein